MVESPLLSPLSHSGNSWVAQAQGRCFPFRTRANGRAAVQHVRERMRSRDESIRVDQRANAAVKQDDGGDNEARRLKSQGKDESEGK